MNVNADRIVKWCNVLFGNMAAHGRSALRDLFDESPTPHIAHPPRTHHRDFYVATDGSFRKSGGGLGAVIETRDGTRVARIATADTPRQQRRRVPGVTPWSRRSRRTSASRRDRRCPRRPRHPRQQRQQHHVGGEPSRREATAPALGPVRDRLSLAGHSGTTQRVRRSSCCTNRQRSKPAHPLANAPHQYEHVNNEPDRCILPEPPKSTVHEFPPPSRADRNGTGGRASD